MAKWTPVDCMAMLVLVVLGTLLIMGRDSYLTTTFCAIAGVMFSIERVKDVSKIVKKNGKVKKTRVE